MNLLYPHLLGYRKSFSPQYAYLSLTEKWKKILYGKGYTGIGLLDLAKTFDIINHELLIA